VTALADEIAGRLPEQYFADLRSRAWIEESQRSVTPDVKVLRSMSPVPSAGGTAVAVRGSSSDVEPITVTVADEEQHENYLEIRCGPDGERLVTAVELLSPSNKTPGDEGRTLYLQKQQEMLRSDVNFIEIDLLRGGIRSTLAPVATLRTSEGEASYHIVLRPASARSQRVVYPIQLWHRLPLLRIPLLPEDDPLDIALQPIFDRCYDLGRYATRVDYTAPAPAPVFRSHEAEYVARQLAANTGANGIAPARAES
jgi:hypothetical protein